MDTARKAGTLSTLKALVLVDMIAERSPRFMRERNSTPWLTDIIWSTAQKMGHGAIFVNASTPIEDDHVPFLNAGVPAADIIDLDYARLAHASRHARPDIGEEPCRSWVMSWWRRSRQSKRGCDRKLESEI